MRASLAYCLPLALLAACDKPTEPPLEPAPGVRPSFRTVTEHFPLAESFSFVTPNPCNGEDVQVSGQVKGQVNLAGEADAFEQGEIVHTEFHLLASGRGTGLTSGATYLYQDVINQGFNSPNVLAPHATTDFEQSFRMVSQGGEPNFWLTVGFHAVYLPPDAAFTVKVDRVSEECRG
jgi:hypothetical protein